MELLLYHFIYSCFFLFVASCVFVYTIRYHLWSAPIIVHQQRQQQQQQWHHNHYQQHEQQRLSKTYLSIAIDVVNQCDDGGALTDEPTTMVDVLYCGGVLLNEFRVEAAIISFLLAFFATQIHGIWLQLQSFGHVFSYVVFYYLGSAVPDHLKISLKKSTKEDSSKLPPLERDPQFPFDAINPENIEFRYVSMSSKSSKSNAATDSTNTKKTISPSPVFSSGHKIYNRFDVAMDVSGKASSSKSNKTETEKTEYIFDPVFGVIPKETCDHWQCQQQSALSFVATSSSSVASSSWSPGRRSTSSSSSVTPVLLSPRLPPVRVLKNSCSSNPSDIVDDGSKIMVTLSNIHSVRRRGGKPPT